MPRYDDVYLCPVCGEAFVTYDEAQDCRDDHHIVEDAGIICECGKAFTSELKAQLHFSKCASVGPGCISCNNYDQDLDMRHAPCERGNTSSDMSACSEYRRIKVVV